MCLVTVNGDHEATRRTGYCDHHHQEFARAKRRWQSAVNNYRRGQSPRDPGPWTDQLAAVEFTSPPNPTITFEPKTLRYLDGLANALEQEHQRLKTQVESAKGQPPTVTTNLRKRAQALEKAAEALSKIADGRAPTVP